MSEELNAIKNLFLTIGMVTVLIFLLFIMTNIRIDKVQTTLDDGMARMEKVCAERDYLDSIMYDHLQESSFISKKEVGVDGRGYFYSKYRNNPNYVE